MGVQHDERNHIFVGFLDKHIATSCWSPVFMFCTTKSMCTTKCNALITMANMWLSAYLLQGCLACFGQDFGAFNWLWFFNIKNRITLSWISWYTLPNKPVHPHLHVLHHENRVPHHMWCPYHNSEHVVGCWPLARLPITCWAWTWSSSLVQGVHQFERCRIFLGCPWYKHAIKRMNDEIHVLKHENHVHDNMYCSYHRA